MSSLKESYNKISDKGIVKLIKRLAGLIVIMVVFTILTDTFLTASNLLTITMQMGIYATLALGIAYVLILGGAELSAGSTVGLTGMIWCLLQQAGLHWLPSTLAAMCVGILVGALNGFMVTKMRMIPFIATLGTQYIGRGVCQLLGGGSAIYLRKVCSEEIYEAYKMIGSGKVWDVVPTVTFIIIAFTIIHWVILNKTSFGRKVFAVGSNKEAARLSGIHADKISILAYTMSGFMAALAGMLYVCRVSTAQSIGGEGYEFEGIAACVVGGISMLGGEGTVIGAIIGASTIAVLRNGMTLCGMNTYWQNVVTGIVLIGAVYLDIRRRSKEAARLA